MKVIIVVALALVASAAALALPVSEVEPIVILRSDFVQQPNGPYSLDFETGDGIVRKEEGELRDALDEENKPHTVIVVRGSYSYINKEGNLETVNYYADETGFHAEGDSIPKPPASR